MIRAMSSLLDGYPSPIESSMALQDSSSDESMILRGLDTWHQCINQQDCSMQLIYKSLRIPSQFARESWMQSLLVNSCLQLECRELKLGDHTSIDYLVVIEESLSWQTMMIKKMEPIREWNWRRKFYKKSNTQN